MDEIILLDRDLLAAAHEALRAAAASVAAGDWAGPTPCDQWNVTQVLQARGRRQLAYVAAITGGGGRAENPFAPSGRLDGTPMTLLDPALAASALAWSTVKDDDPHVPTPLPQGAMPAWLAAGACALDAAVHAWDITVATGQSSPLSAEIARPLLTVAGQLVEPLRGFAYAPALGQEAGDDDTARLLRYLGRRPDWVTAPS